jgi:hypothetical protein
MRTRLLVLIPLALAAVAPATALARPAKSSLCPAPDVTVLFWPKGHHAVPSVGFPRIPTPHLEIYKPDPSYPSSNFLYYADANGVSDASRTCVNGPSTTSTPIAHPKTIKRKRAVTCHAPSALIFDAVKSKRGLTVTGRTTTSRLFQLVLRKKGVSKMVFDSSLCTAGASPH